MHNTFKAMTGSTRRTVLGQLAGSALAASAPSLLLPNSASAAPGVNIPREPLITVWEHNSNIDIAPTIKEVGFNTVWTHDRPCDENTKYEDTLMYRHLQVPGVKYVIAKMERSIWGWTHEQSLKHADWLGRVSSKEDRIIGVYLNDFYGEIERTTKKPQKEDPRDQGGRTEEMWREIIARLRKGNPRLPIWLPCYPPGEFKYKFDFDFDAVISSVYNTKMTGKTEALLKEAVDKFPGKPTIGGLYLSAGSEGRWLAEEEYKVMLDLYVRHINDGMVGGLRIFSVSGLQRRPEYAQWAKEAVAKIKRS